MTKFLKKTLQKNKFKSNIKQNANRIDKNTTEIQKKKTKKDKNHETFEENEIIEENDEDILMEKTEKKPKIKKNKSKSKDKNTRKERKEEIIVPQVSLESIKEHFYTFNLKTELFTILYTTLIFKWIQTERLLILVDDNKLGYRIETFLKSFKINCTFLDSEMPINTNNHFANNFVKGNFKICIANKNFVAPSPNFVDNIIETSPIPVSIIYMDFLDAKLLNDHSFRMNIKSIHHFISFEDNRDKFSIEYNNLNEEIAFEEYIYNKDQTAHLRYRTEDIYHGIKKSDIKKAKTKKINQELLHSKDMEVYFKSNPEEKMNIVNAIKENNYYSVKNSANYLPSYLIHEDTKDNKIEKAIVDSYGTTTEPPTKDEKENNSNLRRKRKSKLQEYLDAVDKNDGSEKNIIF